MPADPHLCVKCQPWPQLTTRATNKKKKKKTGAVRLHSQAPGQALLDQECVVSFAGWAWLRWDLGLTRGVLSQGVQGCGRGASSSSFVGEATPCFDQCCCLMLQVQGQLPGPRSVLLDHHMITERSAPQHRDRWLPGPMSLLSPFKGRAGLQPRRCDPETALKKS